MEPLILVLGILVFTFIAWLFYSNRVKPPKHKADLSYGGFRSGGFGMMSTDSFGRSQGEHIYE